MGEDIDRMDLLSALLDYYGDRTVSFASLFVASIFGLVTVLTIAPAQHTRNYLVFIHFLIFLMFAVAGYYTFQRFGFYANIAVNIEACGLRNEKS